MSSRAESNPTHNKRQKADVDMPEDTRQAELMAALEEEDRLRGELAKAQSRTEEARKCIRAAGEAEFDSLLFIGPDSLSYVLTFLGIQSLGRCEQVCKPIKLAAKLAWEAYEERHVGRNVSAISDVRVRANRLFMAHQYAKQVESQIYMHDHDEYIRVLESNDTDGYCRHLLSNPLWETCCFPDEFENLVSIMMVPEAYEFYMRISGGTFESRFGFDGVVSTNHFSLERGEEGMTPTLSINFRGLDFRRWPSMHERLSADSGDAERQSGIFDLEGSMSVTLVAMPISTSRIERSESLRSGLVCANHGFMKPRVGRPLVYGDARFHVCAESRAPRCPHMDDWHHMNQCRCLRLVQSKSGDFVGWKIDDERYSPDSSSHEDAG